ncbi:MAG: DUF2797 domain-containing protein [Acidimicrobiales bacterium]
MVPLKGSSWRFRVTAQRVCPGTTKFADDGTRSFIECQNPVGQSARCDRCSTIDTVFAANMHRAHKLGRAYVDRRFAAHLDQPHRLYVAGFADGSIKVGTTAGASGGVRLAEQGAWIARYALVADDGYVVRDVEDAVTDVLGVSQQVSSTRKLAGLLSPVATEALEARVAGTTQRVLQMVDANADFAAATTPLDLAWRFEGVGSDTWSGLVAYPNRLDTGNHAFEVADMCGRFAVLAREGVLDRFVADLGTLEGCVIDLGDHDPDPVEVQASLF